MATGHVRRLLTHLRQSHADIPVFSVFPRRNGTVYHSYSGEMSGAMVDPGQDPRGAPDLDPLWLMRDLTREGRGTEWYPKLEYDHKQPETSFRRSSWKSSSAYCRGDHRSCRSVFHIIFHILACRKLCWRLRGRSGATWKRSAWESKRGIWNGHGLSPGFLVRLRDLGSRFCRHNATKQVG